MGRSAAPRLAWTAVAAIILGSCSAPRDELPVEQRRVLIVTGEDYAGHRWAETTPVLRAAIAADPRLEVDVFDELNALGAKDLSPYSALVLHFKNYDPQVPGRAGFDALEGFVQQGGGLVLVHFACGAFEEFKDDYEVLVGRVWFGAEPSPRRAQHDPHGVFTVTPTGDHPVVHGLDPFETTDELYTCLEGETPIEVLAEAVSVRDGQTYPMAFALGAGDGQVFHCVLGHDVGALECAPVAELYRRAAAWAAGLDPQSETEPTPKQQGP